MMPVSMGHGGIERSWSRRGQRMTEPEQTVKCYALSLSLSALMPTHYIHLTLLWLCHHAGWRIICVVFEFVYLLRIRLYIITQSLRCWHMKESENWSLAENQIHNQNKRNTYNQSFFSGRIWLPQSRNHQCWQYKDGSPLFRRCHRHRRRRHRTTHKELLPDFSINIDSN